MNYADLAGRLSQLGERLDRYADKLEGENLGRSAGKLALQLQRFEEQFESYLASRKSGELLLESLLRSPASKRHLTIALVKQGAKVICGKRLKSQELAAAKRDFGVEIWSPPGIDLKADLDEVAALSCALDLVVGFANATLNIAAACGVPNYLISVPGAWTRLGTMRSPWYPATRVFLPPGFGAWDPVMTEVAEAVAEFAKASRSER